jgi:DNA-binding transcriptional MerR regulator
MRVSELARAANVPIPTIKYYLREGLLAPGRRTSPNQARYGAGHVRRLKLIRALGEVGGLSIAGTKEVLKALDNPGCGADLLDLVSAVPNESGMDSWSWSAARVRVERMMAEHGLNHVDSTATWRALVTGVATMIDLGRGDLLDMLEPYMAICMRLADVEASADDFEGVVLGAVLGDVVLSALRRIARLSYLTDGRN